MCLGYFLVGNENFYLHILPAEKWIEYKSLEAFFSFSLSVQLVLFARPVEH